MSTYLLLQGINHGIQTVDQARRQLFNAGQLKALELQIFNGKRIGFVHRAITGQPCKHVCTHRTQVV